MNVYRGPQFRQVQQLQWQDVEADGGFRGGNRPVLIKGALRNWPASRNWTFERLAELRRSDDSEPVTSFQNGLVEQGVTREPVIQATAPYLRRLAALAAHTRATDIDQIGLLPNWRRQQLAGDASFELDWGYLQRLPADEIYLAQWYILKEFPQLRADFEIRQLWPGLRWTWEYTFIGPAHTVTGLHYDFPNNWFCQVSGVKEFLLFPPDQNEHLCRSRKYDWGATLSDIDITRLAQQPREREQFARARGLYARVEAGDALYVPSKTWHAVVALEPSISLAVFGLTPWEILVGGAPSQTRALLHWLRLYRHGNCTCHRMTAAGSGRPLIE